MLPDLFSAFDPGTSLIFQVGPIWFWVGLYVLFWPILSFYYMGTSRISVFSSLIGVVGLTIFKGLRGGGPVGGPVLLVSVFYLILSVNVSGLVPWVTSFSSQLVFSLSLGLPLWLMCVISGSGGSVSGKIGGLVGSGLSTGLGAVIGVIEVGSLLIRPVTLSVRLMANMVAGHVIMGLLMGAFVGSTGVSLLCFSVGVVGLYFFETMVCVIQAYVFILLLGVYLREWSFKKEVFSGVGGGVIAS